MMNTIVEKKRNFVTILGAAVTVLVVASCQPEPPDLCEEGLPNCTGGYSVYGCYNFWNNLIASCQLNIYDAHAWCAGHYGGSNSAFSINCGDYSEETGDGDGDPDWDPREYISNPSAGVYVIDPALVDDIKNSGFSILNNDSNLLVESSLSDYYELAAVVSDDLADQLGLQNGDILLSVNSYSLDGFANAVAAYEAVEDDSTLVLVYKRNNQNYTHTYYITYSEP